MSRFCWGLDLRCCESCKWYVDNRDIDERDKPFRPAADPPKCADWQAATSKAGREL